MTGGLFTSKVVWRSTVLGVIWISALLPIAVWHWATVLASLSTHSLLHEILIKKKKIQTGAGSFFPKSLRALRWKCSLCPIYRWGNWGTEMLSNLPEVIELESGRNRIQNPGRTSVPNTHFLPLLLPSLYLNLVTFQCHLSAWEHLEHCRAERGLNDAQKSYGGESFHC